MKKKRTHKSLAQQLLLPLKILGFTVGGLVIFIGALLIILPRPTYKTGFKNLQELQAFAQRTNELEPISNNNTLKPEFNTYYERYKPTFGLVMREKLTYILSLIHLTKQPDFSPSFFKTLTESLTKEHEKKGLTSGTVICKVTTTPTSKFIIFGNVQGAFHSLVRDFEKLKDLKLINDQLKLCEPETYVFFTGNVINRSCYSMETMAAVARFVQENPDRVFYLKGNHENANYWQEHTLKTELQIRAAHLSKELIPLATEVNNFFATLPEAAYLTIPGSSHEFIRISYAGRTKSEILNENNYADFLTKSSSQPASYTVIKEHINAEPPTPPIVIKVIFRDEKKRETYQPMEGLRFLAPDIDSVAWNILSCPTYVYQRAIKFYHDAFVVLEASAKIDDWKINLYSRDARTKDPFKVTTYNMLSGTDIATNVQMERYKAKRAKKDKTSKTKTPKDKKKKPARSLFPIEEKPVPEKIEKIEKPEVKETAPIEEKIIIKEKKSLLVPPPPPIQDNAQSELPAQHLPKPYQAPAPAQQAQIPPVNQQAPIYQTIIYPNKNDETLEKIHGLLLKITTTLEQMQEKHQQEKPADVQTLTTKPSLPMEPK